MLYLTNHSINIVEYYLNQISLKLFIRLKMKETELTKELLNLRKKLAETEETLNSLQNESILKQTKSKIIEEEFTNVLK